MQQDIFVGKVPGFEAEAFVSAFHCGSPIYSTSSNVTVQVGQTWHEMFGYADWENQGIKEQNQGALAAIEDGIHDFLIAEPAQVLLAKAVLETVYQALGAEVPADLDAKLQEWAAEPVQPEEEVDEDSIFYPREEDYDGAEAAMDETDAPALSIDVNYELAEEETIEEEVF